MAAISAPSTSQPLHTHCRAIAERSRHAAIDLAGIPGARKAACLRAAAARIRGDVPAILAANAMDVAAAPGLGLTPAQIDRLLLDTKRVEAIASGVEAVAAQSDPVGEIIEESTRPNGLVVAQRHRRCRGRGARLRQRDHPPRWQGGGPLEPTTRREHPSCRQRERSPNRLRAAGRCRRSPGRG